MVAIEQIYDEIGGFHWFQLVMVVWVYSIKFMIAWSTMFMSFGGYKPPYACIVSDLQNISWIKLTNDSSRYDLIDLGESNHTFRDVCDVNGTACDEFHYFGVKKTVISEWDLLCDMHWMKASITSIQFGGVLAGSVLGGQSGDYFGRKKTLYGSYLLNTVLNVASAFSVSWQMFTVLRFFIGMMIGMVLVIIVPYPTEFFPLKWRHTIPAIPMWPLGVLAFAMAAWLLEDWSTIQIATAALALPGLVGYFYIPESARWLATRGRLEESYAALEKMARLNGKNLPQSTMVTIEEIAREEKSSRKGTNYSYIDIFRTKATAMLTVFVAFKWCVLSMVFYGLSFAVTSFAGDLYLNMFLMSVVELPAYFLTFIFIDRLGRRWTCLGFLAISTLVSFACVGIHLRAPEDLREKLISACCLTAKLAVAACWAASQTWVTESYPTVTRSLGYGFANTSSRIGAIIAPFVINLDEMPLFTFILMGSLTLMSMVLVCFIPETKDKVMAETVCEQVQSLDGTQKAEINDNIAIEPSDFVATTQKQYIKRKGLTSDPLNLLNVAGKFTDFIPLASEPTDSTDAGIENIGYTEIQNTHRF